MMVDYGKAAESIWAYANGRWFHDGAAGVPYLRSDIAERQIAELRAELNANPRWKPKAEELAVKLVAAEAENARLQNEWDNCDEMLQAARAENARLRALPLKDEVERPDFWAVQ